MMRMKISANQVSVRSGTVGDDWCPKGGIPICADTEMQSRSPFATSGTRGCAPQFLGTSAGHASASLPRRCRRKWQFIGTFRYSQLGSRASPQRYRIAWIIVTVEID